jgi:type IV secretory pathway VirB9-like protein
MRTVPALLLALAVMVAPAASSARPLTLLQYHQDLETVVTCPAGFYCSVALDQGEEVTDAYFADRPRWTPRLSYSGDRPTRPLLIFFPTSSGLRSNCILTTNRRSYYIILDSDDGKEPAHYAMTFPDDMRTFQNAQRAASEASRARQAQAPDPRNCIDNRYAIDRMPVFYYPSLVCNDGRHTFIVLQQFRETPNDLPVLFTIVDGKTAMANYVFDAAHFRYVVDGVPDMMVLVTGSGKNKRTMRVQHIPAPTAPEKKKRKR